MDFTKNKISFLVILLTLTSAFLHFYNLSWGFPFFFHPDENNIATSVSQLIFPTQLNPHFFAYGSLPIYIIFLTGLLFKLPQNHIDFPTAIFLSRFYSALLATLLIPSIYIIGKRIANSLVGLLAAYLTTCSIGIIQFAHFGTFEIWTTFLVVWLFYFSFLLIKKWSPETLVFSGILGGLLLSTKIPNAILLPLPIICGVIGPYVTINSKAKFLEILNSIFIYICVICFIFLITNPFTFLDLHNFLNSIHYESSVATGQLSVFYTGGFFSTIPILFQFTKIYPFLLNPDITMLFIPTFLFVLALGIKRKNTAYLLLATYYLLLFLSQAFLFVKWTRYMIPTLPFIYLCISIAFSYIYGHTRHALHKYLYRYTTILAFSLLVFLCGFYTIGYFALVFLQTDSRIQAAMWAQQHIYSSSNIITEPYDLGITPFNQYFPHIQIINFYDLDTTPISYDSLNEQLQSTDVIILPSQRLVKNRLTNPQQFPNGNSFYNQLFKGNLKFHLVYRTPCNWLCKLIYNGDPIFHLEETTSVFDRPTVFIFKRT